MSTLRKSMLIAQCTEDASNAADYDDDERA